MSIKRFKDPYTANKRLHRPKTKKDKRKDETEMKREIYRVEAYVVDSNGALNPLTGYPKNFDSQNYGNDLEKTLQRAKGSWNEALGAMAKVDTRQCQSAGVIRISDGKQIYKDAMGKLADLPDPEPEPESEQAGE